MQSYQNAALSGVNAYEIGEDFIKVKFQDGVVYLYNHDSTGRGYIDEMKRLAIQGFGLATFISHFVKNNYASRSH